MSLRGKFHSKKVVIFDFDGTICDSLDAIIEELFLVAPKKCRDLYSKEDVKYKIRHESFARMIEEFDISKLRTFFMVLKIQHRMGKYIEELNVFDGMVDVLKKLSCDFELCVLSANSRGNIEKFLKKNGIFEFFTHFECRTSLLDKSKSISKFLKKNDFDVSDCVYVGDEVSDLKACNKVGLDMITVGFGFNSFVLFEEIGLKPKFPAERVGDVLKFF